MTAHTPSSPALKRVARGDLCAGCGACAAVSKGAIEMRLTNTGYLRPHQTAKLSESAEGTIRSACPGLVQKVAARGRKDHVLWGPYLSMRTGWATDDELRYRGASGGALSGLLAYALEAGEIIGALENKADPDRAVANVPVIARTRADLLAAAGSRYAPSAPLAALPQGPGPYAFVGKPCDAAALRVLQGHDPALAAQFPLVISFFCAGVPSLFGGEALLEALGVSSLETKSFRYRGHGWPGLATAVTEDGREASMTYYESWGRILSSRMQHRCKLCADGTGKAADIVCADAWETDENGYPLFDEAPGVSLIVARTEKGAALLARAETAGALYTEAFDVGQLEAMQPGQSRRRQALLGRLCGQRMLGRPAPRYHGLQILKAARTGSLVWSLRNFAGMIRRSLIGSKRP